MAPFHVVPRDEQAVSDYFARFVERRGSQLGFVLAHPVQTAALLAAVRALPLRQARLTPGPQGSRIRGQLETAWLRRHLLASATTVLDLPADPGQYLRGSSRSKYTLRKRSRSAFELGVRVERVDAADARVRLRLLADAYERVNPRPAYRIEQPDNEDMLACRYWFVATLGERPLMLAVLPAEGEWAAMRYFRTLEASEHATLARYLVMAEIVSALTADGVRHIVAGMGPHRLPNGMRQFQRMMGFRIVRLVVSVRRAPEKPTGHPTALVRTRELCGRLAERVLGGVRPA